MSAMEGLAEGEGKASQIERLIASDVLHGSESLCKLLRYLAEHCVGHPGATVKEYEIATEVFKRSAGFDPRLDATVRVQTGRLRSKLAEYYAQEGANDPWIVEIPRGAYAVTFRERPAAPAPVAEPSDVAVGQSQPFPPGQNARQWLFAMGALLLLLTICVISLVTALVARGGVTQAQAPEPLRAFWRNFVDGPDPAWVIFSNAQFVGRPETAMRYFVPGTDDPKRILDHYTGVGEVLAIHELDRIFTLLHHEVRVKRGGLLSLDDAKSNDLIFVGSPSENLPLRDIPTTQDFAFKWTEVAGQIPDLSIVNARPKAGEERVYLATAGLPITEDYAVVGLMPGLNPTKRILVLAGITTLGTQAAVEYTTRPGTVQELLRRTGGASSPFEAVLRVRVSHGVPVHSEIVAFHLRP